MASIHVLSKTVKKINLVIHYRPKVCNYGIAFGKLWLTGNYLETAQIDLPHHGPHHGPHLRVTS